MGGSSDYDNILINKDIDNYFNELISKPIPNQNTLITKSNYNFDKFYSDYIEHNLLFIVLLVGIIIFLIIRHYVKDFDTFNTESNILENHKNKDNNNNNNNTEYNEYDDNTDRNDDNTDKNDDNTDDSNDSNTNKKHSKLFF